MDDIKIAPTTYRVTLKSGEHGEFVNDKEHNQDDYESNLLSGKYSILTSDKMLPVTPDSILNVTISVQTDKCAHCGHSFSLQIGENTCPACNKKTVVYNH